MHWSRLPKFHADVKHLDRDRLKDTVADLLDALVDRVHLADSVRLHDLTHDLVARRALPSALLFEMLVRLAAALRGVLLLEVENRRAACIASAALDRAVAELLGSMRAESRAPEPTANTRAAPSPFRDPTMIRNIREMLAQSAGEAHTASIVAVDANSGKLKWFYQTVPNDAWDLDSVGGFIMADVQIEGKTRKIIMQAPKSGVFYILDRTNGQFISAEPFVPVNWVTGFDKKNNGRPIINPDAYYNQENSVVIYPGGGGAHNWAPMSYNPNAGLVYLTYSAGSYTFNAAKEPDPKAGGGAHGLGRGGQDKKSTPMPIWGPDAATVGRGGLQARDPKTNTIKWVKQGRGSATSTN